jgi:protein tyrosine phosphatase (PTP) superfamily phosphohydrolase (DUF442 family)
VAIDAIKNFIPVTDALVTGGQPTAPQLEEVARAGFEVVVNLGLLDPRYCLPDEQGLTASLGMQYHHIPVDFKAPRLEDLAKFFGVMDAAVGKRVFVHCAANYRVSGFVGLYGQAKLGWSPEQADALVRRVWQPDETWQQFIAAARQSLRRESDPSMDP